MGEAFFVARFKIQIFKNPAVKNTTARELANPTANATVADRCLSNSKQLSCRPHPITEPA